MVVVGRAGGGACTGGGFGFVVVVVVVVVVELVVLTVMSATSGVGTMLTDWVVLVVCEPGAGDETGLESMLHPATPSTTSSPRAANAGIHRAFRVSTGCTLRLFFLDL
ncbi:hypothetical protein GCM10010178_71360 [Lentzea flava]|uniref:Secreted protein n=1 Tax=Lentzea flava TaxID=103732 RepID=A0ABQ2V5S2_9PSEU|nr:hypothetical protein GCM10010178_71360 [Lentzea flava]